MKKLLVIVLTLSVYTVILANEFASSQAFDISPTASFDGDTVQNKDMWDILFTFESFPAGYPAVETDGTNIYCAKSPGDNYLKFDMNGNYLNTFWLAGTSSITDMAYDGTYFYGSAAASMTIFIIDFANQTLIGTIPVTCSGISGVRHIAYDPELDAGNGGFWIGDFNEFGAITMTGAQIHASMTNPNNIHGSAYDPWTDGGPYIWVFTQNGSGAVLYQFEIATLSFTGVTHDASDIPGCTGVAGGLATYMNDDGVFCMIAAIQQGMTLYGVYEIAISIAPSAPGDATNVTFTPEPGGALEAVLDWTCPAVQYDGDPLTDLDEMRVYRDEILIYTDSDPTIGGVGTYTDSEIPATGNYIYTIAGYNDYGEGSHVILSCWVGEDAPGAVENLLLEQVVPDILSGTLTWNNPTAGLNGGVINNPILGYHITRHPDDFEIELEGIANSYTDTTIPYSGFYSYTVVPYNLIGDGGAATSNTVAISDSCLLIMEEFASFPPEGWYEEGGTNWGHAQSNDAGGEIPEARFYDNPQTTGVQRLVSMPVNTSQFDALQIEFKHFVFRFGSGYTLSVQTSSDGTNWNEVWSIQPGGNILGETVIRNISTPDLGSETFQIAWVFEGNSYDIFYWTVDDVFLNGFGGGGVPPNPPVNPIPNDSATGAYEITNLWWDGYAGSFYVYLWDDNGVMVVDGEETTDNFYDLPDDLELETLYHWRIDAGNPNGLTTGTEWSFTTRSASPIINYSMNTVIDGGNPGNVNTLQDHSNGITNMIPLTDYSQSVNCWSDVYQLPNDFNFLFFNQPVTEFKVSLNGLLTFDVDAADPPPNVNEKLPSAALPNNTIAAFWDIFTPSPPIGATDIVYMRVFGDAPNRQVWFTYYSFEYSGFGWIYFAFCLEETTNKVFIIDMNYFSNGGTGSSTIGLQYDTITAIEHPDSPNYMFTYVPSSAGASANWNNDYFEFAYNVGFIEGIVYLNGGAGNVEEVTVTAGSESTNPDETGFYSIEIYPGTYDVTASLDGYEQDTVIDVLVEEDQITSGVDFTLYPSVGLEDKPLSSKITLIGNYPNPFNTETTITFSLAENTGNTELSIYNISGRKVITLINKELSAGKHSFIWKGNNENNKQVPGGIYFYKLKSGKFASTKKMILMKYAKW